MTRRVASSLAIWGTPLRGPGSMSLCATGSASRPSVTIPVPGSAPRKASPSCRYGEPTERRGATPHAWESRCGYRRLAAASLFICAGLRPAKGAAARRFFRAGESPYPLSSSLFLQKSAPVPGQSQTVFIKTLALPCLHVFTKLPSTPVRCLVPPSSGRRTKGIR